MNQLNSIRTWLVVAMASALLAAVAVAAIPDGDPVAQNSEPSAAASYAKSLSQAFRQAARKAQPSVVLIKAEAAMPVEWKGGEKSPGDRSMENPFEGLPFGSVPDLKHFFDQLPQRPRGGGSGIGTGVIIDEAGIILTNNHVVQGRSEITVRLHDGREFKAVEVQSDPNSDIAIVRIEGADNLEPATLGDSDQVEIGDWVLALGHPFGLEGTVTSGIISAKGRGIGMPAKVGFLQTDAAINPGNSGGPLVNLEGEVIGINTAISSRSGGNQGVGFAIPVNLARWVSRQLIADGMVHRAQLGVMIQPLTYELAEKFGLDAREGVLVADVSADTPAAKAGLEPGDVIVEYNGHTVANPRELQAAVEQSEIGAKHEIVVLRDGKRQTLEAVPQEAATDARAASIVPGSRGREPSCFDELGIDVETLTADVAEQLGVKADRGVVITEVRSGSPAERAGLEVSAVIVQADRKPIATVADLRKVLDDSDDDGLLLLVRAEQGSRFVVISKQG